MVRGGGGVGGDRGVSLAFKKIPEPDQPELDSGSWWGIGGHITTSGDLWLITILLARQPNKISTPDPLCHHNGPERAKEGGKYPLPCKGVWSKRTCLGRPGYHP